MIGYIYLTTNLVNGRVYVGQHKREYFNDKYYGSGIATEYNFIKHMDAHKRRGEIEKIEVKRRGKRKKMFKCEICGKKCSTEWHLKQHMSTHV